jgi:hypothetical protein
MARIFRELYGGDDLRSVLDQKQQDVVIRILDKTPWKRRSVAEEFCMAARRGRENGGLPPHLTGSDLFVYLLRNRASL